MPAPILPPDEQVAQIVPAPGSVVWRYSSDARGMAGAGYALLLQVAHPTVGAGVSEHSNYRADPWGRLFRTLDFVNVLIYGGPAAAAEMGRRVRAMHRSIKGVKPDGERYHALEPVAYAWVHATLADAIVRANQLFATPMSHGEITEFWVHWRRLGRLLGVRERDLPETWAEFGDYFDAMVRDELEATDSVRDVLATLVTPARPPVPRLPDGLWRVARLPAARSMSLATVGMLPPLLRERFGLDWTRAQERELRAYARMSRALTPVFPANLKVMGPAYLKWRREAIERGDVAAAGRAHSGAPVAAAA